ncbi:hypothetical protein KRMM14A1004_55010 [Krasilnikovia sp. MM14-A1004]
MVGDPRGLTVDDIATALDLHSDDMLYTLREPTFTVVGHFDTDYERTSSPRVHLWGLARWKTAQRPDDE